MADTIIEKREVPKWVSDLITSKGGLNEFGDPNFRVIWGGNRLHKVGGMFTDVVYFKDEHGIEKGVPTRVADMRTLYKYHTARWHMERWCGAELYGDPEEWYRNTWDEEAQMHVMGDYPTRGDYEHVFFLGMCPHMKPEDTEWCMFCQASMGHYIDLEPNVHVLEMQIYALQQSENVTTDAEKVALFMRENYKRGIRNKVVRDRVMGAMRPQLAVQPTSWQDGTRCSVPEPKFKSSAPVRTRKELGFKQSDGAPETITN
jgi:hypothetical protein